jgi:large subunit ribosomal protein L25
MEKRELSVYLRSQSGKGFSRKLRRQGLIPGVLYGPKTDPILVSIPTVKLNRALSKGWENVLFDLKITSDGESKAKTAMLKELQVNPVSSELLHVDLYEVAMDKEISVEVPVEFVGTAPGISKGGLLQVSKRAIQVECLPSNIPESIKIDVSLLEIGDSIHIRDISSDEGVKILADSDLVVATILPPTVEEAPKPVEEEEVGEEPKEEPEKGKEVEEK